MTLRLEDIIGRLVREEDNETPERSYSDGKVEGTKVEIVVKGVPVLGEITQRERQLMGVTIFSPFNGVTGWTGHIPIFQLPFFDTFGKQGDDRAMSILSNVYEFCCFAEVHKANLLECLEKYNREYHFLNEDNDKRLQIKQQINETREQRSALKKALKAGKINNKEYQVQYMPLNNKLYDLENSLIIDPKLVFQSAFCDFWDTPLYNVDNSEALEFVKNLNSVN